MVGSVKNGCSKGVYELLNEPLASGTIKKWEHLIVPWDPGELVDAYQRLINLVRSSAGDVEHYIVISNANWAGD